MSIYDWRPFAFLKPRAPSPPPPAKIAPVRALAGKRSRVSLDNDQALPFLTGLMSIEPPPDADSSWRSEQLDSYTLSRMSPAKLIELMVDISPEISRALFDFIRMFNPGWELNVYKLDGKTTDETAQAVVEAFIARLEGGNYQALITLFDVVLGRLIIGGFIRGAFAAELVLDEDAREAVDLATPDPWAIRFRKVNDPVRGLVWEPGQYQSSRWVSLDIPTFCYIPIDPLPGRPYGRALVSPAIFTAIFLLGTLHDLRRVIAQQGYPRLDIEIDLKELGETAPKSILSDPKEWEEWVNALVSEVEAVYRSLDPEDAYIHASTIRMNTPVGTMGAGSGSLQWVTGLIDILEKMIIRALKTMPLLMGVNEAAAETHANRQWEIYAAGIKSIQHYLESLLERLFTVLLEAQGIQAVVEFRFAELRASEMLRDEQVRTMILANLKTLYEQGIISQEQYAQEAGYETPDQPAPRVSSGGNEQPFEPVQIPEESERFKQLFQIAWQRAVQISPEGSDDPLPAIPADVEISDRDIERSLELWDELMPDFAGLLDAQVTNQEDFDNA